MNIFDIFDSFKNKSALIVGDSMIDAYMWGEIKRISPEAPVPIVNINKYENRLGGAANVALNIKSLGAKPILCSVIGNDKNSIVFKTLMKEANLSTEGIIYSDLRKTTIKTRVIANNKHQLRIDEEKIDQIEKVLEKKVIDFVLNFKKEIDVIIFQDYNKGILTPNVIKQILKYANNNSIPTIVDPKEENFLSYENCTMFKPNLKEMEYGMNSKLKFSNLVKIQETSEKLRNKLSAKSILLTLSKNGLFLSSENQSKHVPAFKRKIIDVSGAGDTVLSVAALCLASKIDLIKLSFLSCLAGGIVCEEVGVKPIDKTKLLNEALKHIKY